MERPRIRTTVATALSVLLVAAPLAAQLCPPAVTPAVDNRDGYLPAFEEQPIQPMTISPDGRELWITNVPDARVAIFDATNPTGAGGPALLDEVAVGLGPVTIRARPGAGPAEMWVVCSSSNAVFVIDQASRRVTATIRVEHEPGDLRFDATGSTAYVSLAATNQIAVIDTATLQVTNRIEFDSVLPTVGGTRLHAEEPLTLMLEGSDLYAVSHLSGNGSVSNRPACGPPPLSPCFPGSGVPFVAQLWDLFNTGQLTTEPPDRDVIRFDTNAPGNAGAVVGWRFGTQNFDLQRDPTGADLVVSNVDLRNDRLLSEQAYPLDIIGIGKPSIHRISRGPDALPASSNLAVQHFDLNDTLSNVHPALVTMGYTCAIPNQMTWNAAADRLYVACYGTNNVAVLDWPPTQVIAELRSNASAASPVGFGTHGVLLDEARGVLYTYEQGDNSFHVYAANPGAGTVSAPLHPRNPIGFDITPDSVIAGRFHFNNARNSAFGTDSCATCHYRGHFDGLGWDLGDFSGDLPTATGQPLPPLDRIFARDNKLVKVTMSLRGIEETPPFHWRGDRDDLQAFGDAQVGLLGGQPLDQQALEAIDDFIFSLSYRPNPEQAFQRDYTPTAVDGIACFTNPLSLTFIDDTNGGTISVSCNDCHSMDGFSGTNNQVNNDGVVFPVPEDATQLRGLFDKESDQLVTSVVGGTATTIPVSGWGFGNFGTFDTVSDFVDVAGNQLVANTERAAVKQFFKEFDTGTAPSTAFAWTLDQNTVNNIPSEAFDLFIANEAGHNELIARGWIDVGGGPVDVGMFYLPAAGAPFAGTFVSDSIALGNFSTGQIVSLAQAGNASLTLIGTPIGTGFRLSIDREMDFLLDGDEAANGASTFTTDTDGDQFPDGYEVRLGSLPNNPASIPGGDVTPPAILNAAAAWSNSNVAKIRWQTGEESKSRVRIFDAGGNLVTMEEEETFKWQHSLVVRGLIPGQTYTVEVESEDPANANLPLVPGNTLTQTLPQPLVMKPRLFQNSMHVETTNLAVRAIGFGGQILLRATFTIHDGATSAALANHPITVNFDSFEWVPGGAGAITAVPRSVTGTTDAQGRISTTYTTGPLLGLGAIAEVITTSVDDPVGFRMLFQPESGLHGFGVKINLP